MRKRKKIKLSYSKERVLFSDVLPYECPIIFSNRYLYRFLAKYLWVGEEQKDDNITWNVLKQSKRLNEKDANAFAALLFGCYEKGKRIGILQHRPNGLFYPYQFNTAHKTNKTRTLSIIHPYNQWQVVEFYDQYKYSILYLCAQSKFSLRKPQKIAQYFYYRDRLHRRLSGMKVIKLNCSSMNMKIWKLISATRSIQIYTSSMRITDTSEQKRNSNILWSSTYKVVSTVFIPIP